MSTAQPPIDTATARKAIRRGALLTSGAGIAFGVLTLAAWVLLDGVREILAAEADPRAALEATGTTSAEVASLYLLPFAAIFFLWFIVALRGWIRGTQRRRNMLISDVQFVSGAVFTAVFLVAAGALAAAVVIEQTIPGELDGQNLRVLAGFGNTLMMVMGVRIAAIFVIATASLGFTTGAMPRWFNYSSYVFGGLLILVPIVDQVLVLAFPIWVITLSILLLFHVARLRDDEVPGFAARYVDRVPSSEAADLDS